MTVEVELTPRDLLIAFFVEMTGGCDPGLPTGYALAMRLVKAEPEYALAMYNAVEAEFEALPQGYNPTAAIEATLRDFVARHPIRQVNR